MPSLKELSKKGELLSGGHRLCPGCGASMIVRQVLLAAEDPVVVACATGCLEVATTIYPFTAWRVPWIHCAFENAASTISGVEAAYRSLKRQGRINRTVKFIAFGGDGGTYDIGIQALSGAIERGHDFLYICYDNQAYMNCLSTSSLIMTRDGLKRITEVKEGDEIYAFDQKTHQLVLKKCIGVFDNGIKDVYELTTLHHSIKATGNHPFLALKRNGRGRENNLAWKTLSELKPGDQVVALKSLNGGKSFKFDFNKVKKGDYKVNRLNEINLPEYSSSDLMKYLGIYVGDGWQRDGRGLQTTGFRVGKIHHQIKEKGTKCVDRELLKDSEYGYVCFSERDEWDTEKYPTQYKYQNFLIDNKYFEMEEVREIKLVGQEPTLDLRVEGEHNFIADGIVVHNTGIQRSSATPRGAATTTSPVGKAIPEGKQRERKDLTQIIAAHNPPYVAQASPAYYNDLMRKVQKALNAEGPTFINIISPCPRGWRFDPSQSVQIAKLAVLTGFWPLYEVENGDYRITYRPKERHPLREWLESQGRFRHLLKEENRAIVEELQKSVEEKEKRLLALTKME